MTIAVQLLIFVLALDADLLPAQRDFIDDTSHRIVGYIGGFR